MKKNFLILHFRITEIFIFLMLSFYILFCSPYAAIHVYKTSAFYVLCGGYVGIMLLLTIEELIIGSFPRGDILRKLCPKNIIEWCALAYLFFTLLSALFSPYKETWLGATRDEGAVTIAIYVLCFYFVSKFKKLKKYMVYLFGGTLTVFSIISMLQLFGLNPFFLFPAGYDYFDGNIEYSGQYLGTIGNIGYVAALLCIAIPVLWIYIVKAKEKHRFLLLIPLALCFFVLLKMWVLAGIVGIFAGTAITLFALLPKKAIKIYAPAFVLLAVCGFVLVYTVNLGGFLGEVHMLLHGQAEDTFGTGRMYIWKNVLSRVKILFGTGPDTMTFANIPPFERYDEKLDITIKAFIDTAHSEYLNVLFHQGIFALLSFVGMIGAAVFRFLKKRENTVAVIAGSAVLCYAIQALFGISSVFVSPIFWILIALI